MNDPMAPALPGLADATTRCPSWCDRPAIHLEDDPIHLSNGELLVLTIEHLITDDEYEDDGVAPSSLDVWAQTSPEHGHPRVMAALNEELACLNLAPHDAERLGRLLRVSAANATPGIHVMAGPGMNEVLVERTLGAIILVPAANLLPDTIHMLPSEALRLAALLQNTAELAMSEQCPPWCEVVHRGPIRDGRIHSVTLYEDSAGLVFSAQQREAPDGTLDELMIRTYDATAGILASTPLVTS